MFMMRGGTNLNGIVQDAKKNSSKGLGLILKRIMSGIEKLLMHYGV